MPAIFVESEDCAPDAAPDPCRQLAPMPWSMHDGPDKTGISGEMARTACYLFDCFLTLIPTQNDAMGTAI